MMKLILLCLFAFFCQGVLGASHNVRMRRNAVKDTKLIWPGGKVSYVIDKQLDDQKELILNAMKSIQEQTCVQFQEHKDEKDYIYIIKGTGCYSNVGRQGGKQEVSLGVGCNYVGTVLRQLMHVLGFYKEQNRSDRDDNLIIHIENVVPGFESNFKKLTTQESQNLVPFDFDSVMLDGNYFFSKDGNSKTIEAKNGQELKEVYDKEKLSDGDIKSIKKLYSCK